MKCFSIFLLLVICLMSMFAVAPATSATVFKPPVADTEEPLVPGSAHPREKRRIHCVLQNGHMDCTGSG